MKNATSLSAGLLAACLLQMGCAKTIRIKTVDSHTGQPVSGVNTIWREEYHDLIFGSFQVGPTNLPVSSADGAIEVAGVHRKRVGRFVFERKGYSDVYAIYSEGKFTRADQAIMLRGDSDNAEVGKDNAYFVLQEPLEDVLPIDGFFVVELKRQQIASQHP